eukprot:PhF_6_TR11043/c0_g1_i1/m.17917
MSADETKLPDDGEHLLLRQTSYGEVVAPPIPPPLAPEMDELRRDLQVALDEVRDLKEENMRLQAALQAHNTTVDYSVAPNVLVISGSWEFHQVEKVPLVKILEMTAHRPDVREADTPLVGTAYDFGVPPSRQESLRQESFMSETESPITPLNVPPSQVAVSQRAQPPPIKIPVRPSLDPNALLTRSTLETFQRLWAQGASPSCPATAESLKSYIVTTFMKEFKHEPKDREAFGRAILHLCATMEPLLRSQPMHVEIPSPCYVFGDIHGNLEDLVKFCSNLINFWDMNYTPYSFLFLGDYVDRGDYSVECVAYLFAMKVLSPDRVTLLRGNHEDHLVNGDVGLYGETAFKFQCTNLFGSILGNEVWNRINRVFSMLPYSAGIDKKIFCTHGGVPRMPKRLKDLGPGDLRLAMLKDPNFPRFPTLFAAPEDNEDPYITECRQLALDMSWADPSEDDEYMDREGFGMNPRGQGIILFGNKAVENFCASTGYTHIFRAHQEKSDGIKVAKNARVITIFSTSDYVGHQNCAGVVYVGAGKIRMIMKKAF